MENTEEINFNGELVVLADGLPTFSPMAKTIESFKILITRDRGSKGDADGRKKLHSTKELAYIWFLTDRKSPIKNNYKGIQRHKKAIEKLGLPEDWKPDKHIEIAMKDWEELTETQTSKVLEEMRESLFSSQDIISILRKKLDKRVKFASEFEGLPDIDTDTGVDIVDELMKNVKSLMEMASKIPDMITIIEKLEEKVSKEKSDGKGKKGKTISKFQLPKSKR